MEERVEDLGKQKLVELAEKAAPLFDNEGRTNFPHPSRPGKRVVGFVIDQDAFGLGLSEPLFALEALVELARAQSMEAHNG